MNKKNLLLYASFAVMAITAAINIVKMVVSPSNLLVPIVNLIAVAGAFIFIVMTLKGKRNRWLQISIWFVAQAVANGVVTAGAIGNQPMLLMFLPAYGAMITCAFRFRKRRFWIVSAIIAEALIIGGSLIYAKDLAGIDRIAAIISTPITWLCMMIIYIRRQLEKDEANQIKQA